LKIAKFDAASEVSEAYIAKINDHLIAEDNIRQSMPAVSSSSSSSTQRSRQGVEVMKAPKEHYETTVEARWRNIRKDFGRALIAQNNVPQLHFWLWALKDTAEISNGFLHDHPYQTPFEQVYGRKPDALKMLIFTRKAYGLILYKF
jgi:hypothetical protein